MATFWGVALLSLTLLSGTVRALDLDHAERLITPHHHDHHSSTSRQSRIAETDTLSMVGDAGVEPPLIAWGTNDTHIEIELTYPTKGWLALGLTPNGGMDQSDVLFGYVDDETGDVIVQVR